MAFIEVDKMEKKTKDRMSKHDSVFSTYSIDASGLFQIDTYGSLNREQTDRVSQTIQLDKVNAAKLVKLINSEFLHKN